MGNVWSKETLKLAVSAPFYKAYGPQVSLMSWFVRVVDKEGDSIYSGIQELLWII